MTSTREGTVFASSGNFVIAFMGKKWGKLNEITLAVTYTGMVFYCIEVGRKICYN